MKRVSTERVIVELGLTANINGASFSVVGQSCGVFGSGDIAASVRASQATPNGFHISILPFILLTGQPSMSRVTVGAVNPFLATGGVYHAIRSLKLGRHGELLGTYRVERARKGLRAVFDVSGEIDVPPLISIAPTIETWV